MKLFHIRLSEPESVSKTRNNLRYFIAFLIPLLIFLALKFPFFYFINPSAPLIYVLGVLVSAINGRNKSGIITTIVSVLLLTYDTSLTGNISLLLTPSYIFSLVLFAAEGVLISITIEIIGKRSKVEDLKEKIKTQNTKITSLEKKNEFLRKEIRSRDEFLSIASHELKTPLTSMLLQTQHALHNIKNVSLAHFSIENLLRMLENVENQTKRLSKMINDFLNISLITTGNLQLDCEKVNLNATVERVIEEFGPKLTEEHYKLTIDQKNNVNGYWDKTRIEQIISNLISNAIKYGSGKPIEVTVKNEGGRAQILIKDHGIGVPDEKKKKVFELFERGVAKDKYTGIGVGLFITNEMVKAHHGTLSFLSKENKGSVFKVELPLDSRN